MSPSVEGDRGRTSESAAAVFHSKYNIARRNRSAKFQFLHATSASEMDSKSVTTTTGEPSRFKRNTPARRSLPGYSRTEGPFRYGRGGFEVEEDEAEFEKRDLSIPGTPVSSRHVMSLKYRNQLADKEREEKEKEFETKLQETDDPLMKFIESMKKLAAQKRADLEQGIVMEVPKPKLQTPPSPLPRSRFGYNAMGSWNGDSNLRSYTPLFQRSMTVKLSSINVDIPKPNPVNDKLSAELAAGPGCATTTSQSQTNSSTAADNHKGDWERPNLPKPPTSLIINPKGGGVGAVGEDEQTTATQNPQRRPLKHRSLSNADTFYEIRSRLER